MKCPYCGGDATGTKCPYCNSDLTELMKAQGIEVEANDEGDDEITDEMIEKIKKLCREFQAEHKNEFSCYEIDGDDDRLVAGKGVKDQLFDVLDIPDDEEVFLIHDDTMLHTGKNGFAITDGGFYCKEMTEDLEVTDLEDIDEDDEADCNSATVYLKEDKTLLAYYTGSGDVLDDLCDLYNDIIDVLYGEDED